MKTHMRLSLLQGLLVIAVAGGLTAPSLSQKAEKEAAAGTTAKEITKTMHASGTFEVKLAPQDDKTGDATLGRMTIDKQFHGDLEAVSKGQMLSAFTAVKDSAGYVAIEKVSGTLNGSKGTFVLQHSGTMTRGVPELIVTVVPDSGTEQLAGLTGKMTIKIADGKHFYEFEYSLSSVNRR